MKKGSKNKEVTDDKRKKLEILLAKDLTTDKVFISPTYKFDYLRYAIENWATTRGFFKDGGATVYGQSKKLIEECLEVFEAVVLDDENEFIDGIGDTLVVLIVLCKLYDVDILDCLEKAYNTIKTRKGHWKDGIFVKEN